MLAAPATACCAVLSLQFTVSAKCFCIHSVANIAALDEPLQDGSRGGAAQHLVALSVLWISWNHVWRVAKTASLLALARHAVWEDTNLYVLKKK